MPGVREGGGAVSAYVVTPSGEIIEYWEANFAVRGAGKIELYTHSNKSTWVADIPADWAVGWSRPHALGTNTDAAALKRALRNFDLRTGRWKG